MKKSKIGFEIPADLKQKFKIVSTRKGKSMTDILLSYIAKFSK